jgi:shikimate dehydrogenase
MIISAEARVAGIIGWPVDHSLSPRLHGYWLEHYAVDGAYVPLAVRPEAFAEAVAALPGLGFAGANVTLPHKEAALAAVASVDAVARRIGAVNTRVVGPDGDLSGSNSDAFGFLGNLRQGAPGWRPQAGPAVVLGAGGAARAVAAALVDAGVPEVRLVNRTATRAETVAADIGGALAVRPWEERSRALADAALLVNATSLGMRDKPPLDLDLATLSPTAVVNDIVYVPLETPLLTAAAGRGNPVVDGLGMLLHQARPGFAAWFGVEPEVTEAMRAFVLSGLGGG